MNHISVFTGIYLKLLPESTNTGWLKETFVLVVGKVIAPDSFLKSNIRTPALKKKKAEDSRRFTLRLMRTNRLFYQDKESKQN